MSVGSTGAKEFTLKASDGVVKCVRLTHMYILSDVIHTLEISFTRFFLFWFSKMSVLGN